MSKKPLDENVLDLVTGGAVHYVCNSATERYCWGDRFPDQKYEFRNLQKFLDFCAQNYEYYGEAGIFQALCEAGICRPMQNNN